MTFYVTGQSLERFYVITSSCSAAYYSTVVLHVRMGTVIWLGGGLSIWVSRDMLMPMIVVWIHANAYDSCINTC